MHNNSKWHNLQVTKLTFQTRKIVPGIILGAIFCVVCIAVRLVDPAFLGNIRGSGFDALQRIWPRELIAPRMVTVVDIDEASLKARGQWPWPRTDMAKLVDELDALGASAIVFDIVFPETDRMGTSNDVVFAEAIKGRPIVNAFASSPGNFSITPQVKAGFVTSGNSAALAPPHLSQLTQNLLTFDEAAAGLGSMNIDLAQKQGVTRQIPLLLTDGKNFYPSLSLEALRVAQAGDTYIVNSSATVDNAIDSIRIGDFEIPTSEEGELQVYYRHNNPAEFISAASVISGNRSEKLRSQVQGHIILIGTSAVGLLDIRTSALGEAIPGVAVHAQALEQILSNQFLSRSEWIESLEIWSVALLGLAISILTALLRPLKTMIATCFIIAGLATIVTYGFARLGVLIDFTWPFLSLVGTYIASTAYRLLITDRDGRKLRYAFGHYVAPTVLSEIERNPSALKLGGEQREVTVMFVDIENFTPLAETLPPEKLVQLVNTVLQICSTCILAEGGTIDKYIGDAVMAFWNAPLPKPDHQYHACLAALHIQNELKDYKFEQQPITVRIGIASGAATVGNMGSSDRFNYSVLGETVNTAARAEQACKRIAHNISIAGALHEKTKTLTTLPAGHVAMKGISNQTPIFAIVGDENFPGRTNLQNAMTQLSRSKANCEKLARAHSSLAPFFRAIPTRDQDFINYVFKP
jgi:adenylate cyclase